ncbi:MAG: EAL domain-containing protein [Pseudomonadota bacterium]
MSEVETEPVNGMWYQVLFVSSPWPMLVYDPASYRLLDVNASAIEHYGYSRDEWRRLTMADLSLETNFTGAAELLAALPDTPVCRAGPWRHVKKDGAPIDIEVVRHRISYGGNSAALLIVIDVSTERQLQESLRNAKQELDRTQHIARLGSWIRDFDTRTSRWSDQTYRNFGLQPQSTPAAIKTFLACVYPADRARVGAAVDLAVATRQPFAFEHRVVWPDGSIRFLRQQGIVLHDHDQHPVQLIGTSLDVTEQSRTESALRQAQKDLQCAQRAAHIGTWVLDTATGKFDSWSDETFRLLGYDPPELRTYDFVLDDRIHRDDRERVRREFERTLADPTQPYDAEFRVLNPTLGERIVHSVAEAVPTQDGQAPRLVGFVQDVTESRRAEEQTKYFAFFDKATQLPNRTSLEQVLEDGLAARDGAQPRLALLMIHLTRFREINFTLSHGEGDQLLRAVGSRIRESLDGDGFVARVGSSQFAVALMNADGERAGATAQTILAALHKPFLVAGISYGMGAHAGIALAPIHGGDAATILRKTDVALFQAKQAGQAWLLYDPNHDPYNPQRLALIGEFRKSLLAGELRLYCQPKADIRTGKIIGAEALVRWEHPTFGLIPPNQFIPLIEPTELIHVLSEFMLEASIKQSLAWRRAGFAIPIAVNLSPRDLIDPSLVQHLRDTLAALGAAPDCLGLEITESSLLTDPQLSIAQLNRLSGMGFRLYVDDFGTGYSSLSYLMSLPVNVIKIDHSFTMRMIDDKKAATIVRSTIELAHNLGLKVVAEGAASKKIWDALHLLGCDEAQGYFISPALPADDFLPWMRGSGFGAPGPARQSVF